MRERVEGFAVNTTLLTMMNYQIWSKYRKNGRGMGDHFMTELKLLLLPQQSSFYHKETK